MRSRLHAVVDPYRASLGFARAAASRGARIFERSPVTQIRPGRTSVAIKTEGGSVTASAVVVATGFPSELFKPLQRRFTACDSYAVLTPPLPADVRRHLPSEDIVVRDDAAPDHWLRWVDENRVLFSGADQPKVPERGRARALVQRTGQLMYELSVMCPDISGVVPECSWDACYARSADGVPYFGPHRNYPHHLFAFGAGPGGLGLSHLGARIMLRHHLGKPDKGDELFYFTRIRE
jgi:glycine/D-amino acid oxidase-like deaminating enzyme